MNIDHLKATLRDIESRIVAITGNDIEHSDHWLSFPDKCEVIRSLLENRRHILNRMFQPTEENMRRFRAVNDRLYYLTQQLFDRVKIMDQKLPLVMDCPDFDDDYEIEGTLQFSFNGECSVLKFYDDSYYGSDFMLMIKLIADLSHDTVNKNIELVGLHSHPLDDGQSWNEFPFVGKPEFEDIVICHAVHQITDHQLYSIPDLIRLNDFWAEVHLIIQSITEQDGTRYIP